MVSRLLIDVGRTLEEFDCLSVLLARLEKEKLVPPEGTLKIHFAGPKTMGVLILTFSIAKKQVFGENGTRDQLVDRFTAWLQKKA